MSVPLVATVGAADANSYLDVTAATAEINLRLNVAAWGAASTDDRARALIEATRMIDNNRFNGYRISATQRLQFPRSIQEEAPTVIPDDVIQAVLDQALVFLTVNPDVNRAELQAQGVIAFSAGSHSETFGARSAVNGGLCHRAVTRLGFWLSRTGRIVGPRETARNHREGGGWNPLSQ